MMATGHRIMFHMTCSIRTTAGSAAPVYMERVAPPRMAKGWYFIDSARPSGKRLTGITVPDRIATIAARMRSISQFMFLSFMDRQANKMSIAKPSEMQRNRLTTNQGDAGLSFNSFGQNLQKQNFVLLTTF